ncbi:MAG: prolyl oligopeptidase family serine peptidase [Prevotella sp.]|nr:prolyl oligopeptidase family serine peptidase [Prevotella sp.]
MRRTILLLSLFPVLLFAQEKREKYEFYKDFPVYADSLIASLDYPLAWGNSPVKDFIAWKELARDKVLECMMAPPPRPSSFDYKVIAEEKRDGYTARKIEINLSTWYRVPAYLLVPDHKGTRLPAINLLHDHGAHLFIGKEKMIEPIFEDSVVQDDARKWVNELYDGVFVGDMLARAGYVVVCADAPLWGERGRKEGVDRQKYDLIAGNMMMYGRDLSAFMTYDDIALTDFLATLPYVDNDRIGCFGFSMGGYRSWMLAALSPRIKASAVVCWMVTTDVQMTWNYGRKENGGFANCIPALRQYLDYPHIASLACPEPMLVIAGKQDKLFPLPGVEKAFGIMHQVWDSKGVPQNLKTELLDMPHHCGKQVQATVLDFFNSKL